MKNILILGSGIGGLSAAINARLKGYNVKVIEKAPIVGGKAGQIVQDGYIFDPGPSIVIMPWVYKMLFKKAGKNFDDYVTMLPLQHMYSLITQDGREYNFPVNRKELLNYVAQNFPDDLHAFEKIFQIGDKIYPLTKKTVFDHAFTNIMQLFDINFVKMGMALNPTVSHKKFIDGLFESPILRALFYGFPSYSGLSYKDPSPGALLIPYILATEGVFYPKGGIGKIISAFYDLAKELGVEFVLNEQVLQVNSEENIVKSVTTDKNTYQADYIISNIDRHTTLKLAGVKVKDYEPSSSFATWQIGYKGILDSRILHHTLLLPDAWENYYTELYDKQNFSDLQIVYINRTSITDDVAPKGCDNLFFVLTVPANTGKIDWQNVDIKKVVIDNLHKFGLNLDESLIQTQRFQNPLYFENVHQNYKGALYGPTLKNWTWRMFPQKNVCNEFSNLVFCGGTVQPGAGLPMSALSGMFAVDLISKE